MSSTYTGNPTAAEAPSSAPGLNVVPLATMPSSGDALTVASVAQRIKVALDGVTWTWDTTIGLIAQIRTLANEWTGLNIFDATLKVLGNLAGVQSDITPNILYSITAAGNWKLVDKALDTSNNAASMPYHYIAGAGSAYGAGADAYANNAVWNPAAGGTWSCIDTSANATLRIQSTQGTYFLYHAPTAGTWAQTGWTLQTAMDAATGDLTNSGTIAGVAAVTAGTSISATTSVGAGTTVTAGTTLIGQKASLSVARSSATGGSGQAVAAGDVYKDTAAFGWATFTVNVGTGAPTLVRGANVATVAAGGGLGFYVVTMQTAATNILIPVVSSGSGTTRLFCDVTVISTTVINLTFRDAALAPQDPQYVNVIVFQG